MNRFRVLSVAFALLCLLVAQSHARTLIVVLPPDTARDKREEFNALASALAAIKRGDQIVFYSARGEQLATIRPSEDPRTSNPAWAKRKLAEQFAPVLRTLAMLPAMPDPGNIPDNIMIPDVLNEIGRNVVPALPDKKADVLVLGGWLYFDPRDGRFAMTNRFYPSDAHIKAAAADSPFGTNGLANRLSGATIHYCWPGGQDAFATKAHEESVRRFWSLWTRAQDGTVGTFSYDLTTCLKRALANDSSGQATYTLGAESKLEMLRARPPLAATVPASMAQPGEYFLRDDIPLSHTPPSTTLGVAWIGIKWTAPCDLDLYTRGDTKSPWLFYGSTRTDEGLFNKDFTSATGDKQFEFVEYTRAIDLSMTEIAINLYAGDLPTPPEGVVRVWFGGKVYEAPFKIAATRGNRGAMPISGGNWLKIDPRKVVGLNPG